MPAVRRFIGALSILLLGLLTEACSPTQDSFTAGIYHNVTARFNGYFYAKENILSVEATILKSLDDDHNTLLRLYPRIDTSLAKGYQKETDEAIKMASIAIQRHPGSRWVYPAYIMVGLARLYRGEFQDAVQTFKYVNTKSNNAEVRHEALIRLLRAFTEMGDYRKALETAEFLSKEKLSRRHAKERYLELAYLYQVQNDFDGMVRNLSAADTLLSRSDRRARIYFIVGQVYQKLGFSSEAYNYYRKCLATKPDYEIDFFARINLAQVTRVTDAEQARSIRRQLAKMLVDEKNKEFIDKIHYEIAEFEMRQGNLKPAIDNYRACLHTGTSQRVKGMGYLKLGQIYYDSSRRYDLAKLYYDSAVTALPEDTEGLADIKKRQSILGEFAEYTGTIKLQDSLLAMARLDTGLLHRRMDSTRQAIKMAENASKPKKKAKSAAGPVQRNTITDGSYQQPENTTSDWYFGNPSAVAVGQGEFQRIWGTVKLEDNWRRSQKSSLDPGESPANAGGDVAKVTAAAGPVKEDEDPFYALYAQLPLTAEKQAEAMALIEEAYFKLGDLYYFRLNEKSNALQTYLTLLDRFPDTKLRPEILYKLFLAAKDLGLADALRYRQELISRYPENTLSRLVVNPNYLAEETATAERQKSIYREAYALFQSGQLIEARRMIEQAIPLGKTDFVPQLRLLQILIIGRSEDITLYQYELGEFTKAYPDHALTAYVKTLLETSQKLQQQLERTNGIRFTRDLAQPHQLVIVHPREADLSSSLTGEIEKFNQKNPTAGPLVVSNLVLDETSTMTMVLEFTGKDVAQAYLQRIRNEILQAGPLANHNFNSFVITKDNFGIFYRTRALAEYLAFYEQNYRQ